MLQNTVDNSGVRKQGGLLKMGSPIDFMQNIETCTYALTKAYKGRNAYAMF